ncbi:hypothetical protein Sjap_021175 [Stephania japonica]|uniref:EF-hand domain-containing protein n=1 Tax=Stephania japonica TaxID=461633 RepID=A0AAP0I0W2_9MAGN
MPHSNSSARSQPPPSPGSTFRTSTCLIRPLERLLWRKMMQGRHKANQGNKERKEVLLSKIDELPNLFSGEIEDPKEYFNKDGALNITKRGKDYDKDDKLNLTEFRDFVSETQIIYNARKREDDMQNVVENFAELDLNMNKFLTIEELRHIFQHFNPAELSYAKQYTKYLIDEVSNAVNI